MLKKRLIYTLLLQNNIIQLSRNFSLQSVGSIDWLYKYYDFDSIAYSVDELIFLNVAREIKNSDLFAGCITALSKKCHMPIAAGGGIGNMNDAYRLLAAGADKLVINSALFDNPDLVVCLVKTYGSQCIVASIDYKRTESATEVFVANGTRSTDFSVEEAVNKAVQLGAGEIYLTSMDRDGTGQGYDVALLRNIVKICQVPIIISGGVGEYDHFVAGMQIENVTGASTANIFNFIGDGLTEARRHILQNNIHLASWDFSLLRQIS